MSAHSFISHRMFVAALSHEETTTSNPEADSGPRPSSLIEPGRFASIFQSSAGSSPNGGVLLANAMLHGYQSSVS